MCLLAPGRVARGFLLSYVLEAAIGELRYGSYSFFRSMVGCADGKTKPPGQDDLSADGLAQIGRTGYGQFVSQLEKGL